MVGNMGNCSSCGRKIGAFDKKYDLRKQGQGFFCFGCMKCSVCGSEARGENRYREGGKSLCEKCIEGNKSSLRKLHSIQTYLGLGQYHCEKMRKSWSGFRLPFSSSKHNRSNGKWGTGDISWSQVEDCYFLTRAECSQKTMP